MSGARSRVAFTGGLLFALLVFSTTLPAAVTDEDVDYSFSPYKKDGFPKVEGVRPGVVINKDNVESFKQALDPGTFEIVKRGWYEISVAATEDFVLHSEFIAQSRRNTDVKIVNANLANYVNGRPFPYRPDEKDPAAGEKIIWNFQYGRVWGDLGCLEPWYWNYNSIKTNKNERTIKYDRACFARFAFRSTDNPKPEWGPNPNGVYRGIYLRVAEPFDLKDTQLLIHKYKDDTKQFDGWIYLGFQKRVRRFATGQITDAFLGSDIMIEDFEGYEGKVSDYTWAYKGSAVLLMPMWNHNKVVAGQKDFAYTYEPDNYKYINYTGRGKCFPDAPWQLRRVYLVEGRPRDPNHPISKRMLYFDAQINETPISLIYDRKGNWWKWFHIGWPNLDAHLPINKGKGASIGDTASQVDVQAEHCTALSFRGRVDAGLATPALFDVQNMRSSGR
jgi:hypothetical protein